MTNRLTILKYFTVNEIVELIKGKLFLKFRNAHFKDLQDRENKLTIILRSDPSANIKGSEVTANFSLNKKVYQIYLRLNGSDVWVFNQVVLNKGYQYVIQTFRNYFGNTPMSIIDAGANIGLSILYFKSESPDSHIIGIEPDKENYNCTHQNLTANQLSSITLHHGALWPTKKKLEIVNDFRDMNEWSLRVEENSEGEITSFTPQEMVSILHGEVDIFKIDIEGGEAKIFETKGNLDWLKRVRLVVIEIHDEFSDRKVIVQILEDYEFIIFQKGELTIGVNSQLMN